MVGTLLPQQTGVVAYAGGTVLLESLDMLGQELDPSAGLTTLFTQLGVFAVVVVVFKFMLNRQDTRDSADDARYEESVNFLRDELAVERTAHEETRSKLYAALSDLSDKVEDT